MENPTATDASARSPADPLVSLREDQAARWAAGDSVPVEAYVREFRGLADEDVLALIVAEARLRAIRGDRPTAAEYQRRFPKLAHAIAVRFEALGSLEPVTTQAGDGDPNLTRPGNTQAEPPETDGDGRVVPGHDLLDEIGRGGMGVVYRARDVAFGRDVAVKVLQDRYPATGPGAARFLEEARITGQLQHPGIPPVHQVGTLSDGRPFLVMKLIKGRTLADTLAAGGTPDRGRLVAVFEQVCQAVGYAHAHRVIHRDLKPANVMVGAFGEVQVMDWGLAKILREPGEKPDDEEPASPELTGTEIHSGRDADSATQTGSVLGTPAYMAPEQAGGEISRLDERTDVFGLGAMLCAILTGQPPYVGRTAEAVRLMAIRGQLADAFARLDSCGAEPELIELAKRCLAVERDDRPRDAGEVAKAVAGLRSAAEERARQAELDRVRVEGERRAAELKATEQRKRRRVLLALAGSVLALVAVSAAGAWWAQRSEAARERAERDREKAEATADATDREAKARERGRAEELVESARDEVYELIGRALWDDAGREIDRAAAVIAPDEGNADLRAKLDNCRRDLKLAVELDRIQFTRASSWGYSELHQTSDETHSPNQQTENTLRAYGFDVRVGEVNEVAARIKASPLHPQLLTALDLWMFNEPNLEHRIRLWAITCRVGHESWRESLKTHWFTPALVRRLITTSKPEERTPALYMFVMGRLDQLADDPLPFGAEACRRYPSDFLLNFWHGVYANKKNRPAEAVGAFRTALALRPQSASLWGWLGYTLWLAGEHQNAIECARKTLALDPGSAAGHLTLTGAYAELNDLKSAEAACRAGLAVLPSSPSLYRHLGVILRNGGRLPEAIAAFRESTRLYPDYWIVHGELGECLHKQGDLPGAIAAFKHAGRALPSYRTKFATLSTQFGAKLALAGDYPAAIAAYREAVQAEPKSAAFHHMLGTVLRKAGDLPAAIVAFRQATQLDPKSPGYQLELAHALATTGDTDGAIVAFHAPNPLPPNTADVRLRLGWQLCQTKKDFAAGLPLLREAVLLEPANWVNANDLGCCLRDAGRLDDALVYFAEAQKRNPNHAFPHRNAGHTLWLKGDRAAAIASHQQAVRLDRNYLEGWEELALYSKETGDLAGAAAAYREILRLNPNGQDARRQLAITLARLGDTEGAVAALHLLRPTPPDSPTPRWELGKTLCGTHRDFRAGLALLREAVMLAPTMWEINNDLGYFLGETGRYDDALVYLARAQRLAPGNPVPFRNAGRVLWAKGDRPAAIAAYRQGVDASSSYLVGRIELAVLLRTSGDLPGAAAEIAEAQKFAPKSVGQALIDAGIAFRDGGRSAEAEAAFRELIGLEPRNRFSHGNLAVVLWQRKDYAGAAAAMRDAVACDPAIPEAHRDLGYILRDGGDLPGAAAALREYVRLQPKLGTARQNLGHVLALQGDWDGAVAAVTEAMQLDPNLAGLSGWLRQLRRSGELGRLATAVLAGTGKPANLAETVELAIHCVQPHTKRYALSLWLFDQAFAADPKLLDDQHVFHRTHATRAAVLLAVGGDAEVKAGYDEWFVLNRRARDTMTGGLAILRKLAAGDRDDRNRAVNRINDWKADPDLLSVRDPKWLEVMPEPERSAWRAFWAEADAVARAAAGK